MVPLDMVPRWHVRDVSSDETLSLGKVTTKALRFCWHKEGVHQVVVWIGTAIRGQGYCDRPLRDQLQFQDGQHWWQPWQWHAKYW